jgi:hypothetical protein
MFVIKIKGTDQVSDFVEIRDKNFFLVEIIKYSNFDKKLKEICPNIDEKIMKKIISSCFGQIIEVKSEENETN